MNGQSTRAGRRRTLKVRRAKPLPASIDTFWSKNKFWSTCIEHVACSFYRAGLVWTEALVQVKSGARDRRLTKICHRFFRQISHFLKMENDQKSTGFWSPSQNAR